MFWLLPPRSLPFSRLLRWSAHRIGHIAIRSSASPVTFHGPGREGNCCRNCRLPSSRFIFHPPCRRKLTTDAVRSAGGSFLRPRAVVDLRLRGGPGVRGIRADILFRPFHPDRRFVRQSNFFSLEPTPHHPLDSAPLLPTSLCGQPRPQNM